MTSKPGSGPAGMNTSVKIGAAAFIMAVVILLGLMLVSGLLTVVLESGSYERISVDGRVLITPGSYQVVEKPDYPFWRWFTAPVEILFTEGNVTLITLILFLFAVGGSITILEQIHVMDMLIQILIDRFKASRYLLMGVVILLFMALPSLLGIYEGLVPVIIFVVPMARRLGWDSLTGLGMSLLPMAFGLSAAISNPFTIAVAQTIADLPIFSGAWLRIIFFVLVYAAVYGFVYRHARKVEEDPGRSIIYQEDRKLEIRESKSFEPEQAKQVRRGLTWFSVWIGIALLVVLSVAFFPDLGFLAFPLMGLMFLIGGFGAGVLSGYRFSRILGIFLAGGKNIIPGALLIMLAYSVKYIIDSGMVTDTLLFMAAGAIEQASPFGSVFLVYLITLVMNFFIGSASAKAFLMMPILVPLADLVGITRQTAVLAFGYGDGFSNMIFPTNPLLLIALSFTVVSYVKWIRWTLLLQFFMAALSLIFMFIAVSIGYGPF
jgi:uncharacterized ion transporter superfamily protein YfcC